MAWTIGAGRGELGVTCGARRVERASAPAPAASGRRARPVFGTPEKRSDVQVLRRSRVQAKVAVTMRATAARVALSYFASLPGRVV